MLKVLARRVFPLVVMMATPMPALALCCPGDIAVIKAADSGLGQRQPDTTNLSLDSRWRVHAFERDGIGYFQVSDSTGELDFIIGNSGSVFWVLPAGRTDPRISLPHDDRVPKPLTFALKVYQNPEFTLWVNGTGSATAWWVENRPTLPSTPSNP